MMTKKDFEALATILKDSETVEAVALAIAEYAKAQNPRFNSQRFLKAAEMIPADAWE